MPERDETAGAAEDAGPPPPEFGRVGVAAEPPPLPPPPSAAAGVVRDWLRLARRSRPGPASGGRIRRPGGLLPAAMRSPRVCFGFGAGRLVVARSSSSVASCAATRLSASWSACSRLAARSARSSFEVGDQGVELVGRDIAGAQGDPGELVTLEHVVQVGGVLEQRAERGGAAADERAQRHLAEAAAQLGEFGFLGGDPRLGFDDLGVELRSWCRSPRRTPRRAGSTAPRGARVRRRCLRPSGAARRPSGPTRSSAPWPGR